MMKLMNLKVRSKLLLGFGIVMVFTLILAISAIASVSKLDDSYTYLLEFPEKNLEYLLRIDKLATDMRHSVAAIALNAKDKDVINNYWTQFEQAYADAIQDADLFLENNRRETVRDANVLGANIEIMKSVKTQLEAYRKNAVLGVETARKTGEIETTYSIFFQGMPLITEISNNIHDLIPKAEAYIADVSALDTAEKDRSIMMFLVLTVVILLLSVMTAFYISGIIGKPLALMSKFLKKAGETGDVVIDDENHAQIEKLSRFGDEIGQISNSLAQFIKRIVEVSKALESVANGDLSVDFSLQSDQDVLGISLKKMVDDLNRILIDMRTTSEQVSAGANQISQSAQSLASGSTEQASSIEDFSISITSLLKQTNENAENSKKAHHANSETSSKLENSINSMVDMVSAMKAIDESSNSITQIIKVIDDIAFQTNILALNAAVEAARAGLHGKGFAVVAEEVRNLAAKSAEAAKETAALIESSSGRVKTGNQIVERTNLDLKMANDNAKESTRLIEMVKSASVEQAKAISVINQNIEQISAVIQANSALSQQSAASAQQMSAQSVSLNQIVEGFKLKGSETNAEHVPIIQEEQISSSRKKFSLNSGKNDSKYESGVQRQNKPALVR